VIMRDGWYLKDEMDLERHILLRTMKQFTMLYPLHSTMGYLCLYMEYFSLVEHLSYQN
jgi:hypothetical protein